MPMPRGLQRTKELVKMRWPQCSEGMRQWGAAVTVGGGCMSSGPAPIFPNQPVSLGRQQRAEGRGQRAESQDREEVSIQVSAFAK